MSGYEVGKYYKVISNKRVYKCLFVTPSGLGVCKVDGSSTENLFTFEGMIEYTPPVTKEYFVTLWRSNNCSNVYCMMQTKDNPNQNGFSTLIANKKITITEGEGM